MKSLKKAILTGVLTGITLCTMTICSNAATVKVTTETLNVRKGPSTSTEVIAMLSEGVECELLGEEGNWYKVKYKNYTGYVSKDYAKLVGASSSNNSNENNTQSNLGQNSSTENTQSNNSQQNNNTENNQNNNSQQNNSTENNQSNNAENNNSQQNSSSQNNQTSNSQENNEQDEVTITYKKFNKDADIKLLPLIHSSKIGSVKSGTQVIFITEASGWSYIQTDLISGWVRCDTLSEGTTVTGNANTSEKKGYVNESSVNLRKGAGTSNSVVKVLTLNTEVTIVGEEGDWYKVKAGSSNGYILKEYVSDSKKVTSRSNSASRTENEAENTETTSEKESTSNKTNTTNNVTTTNKQENTNSKSNKENTNTNATSSKTNTTTKTETTSSKTNTATKSETTSSSKKETSSTTSKNSNTSKIKGTDIVAYAQKYLGYKYVYGGDGSNNTFDCSGFTMYVFKHFGINLAHGANAQYNSGKGKKISKQADLQVGDIVFLTDYETGKGIGHCGIYLGNGNFIHASTTTYSVTISSLNTMYKGRFYAGLRLI